MTESEEYWRYHDERIDNGDYQYETGLLIYSFLGIIIILLIITLGFIIN